MGEPTKLPVVLGGVRMLAVAVPAASTPPLVAFTVIVSTWFVPTGLVAFCGVIWMNASTQFFAALAQLAAQPAVTLAAVPVVRVTLPAALVKPTFEVACTWVRPPTAEVIVTVQLAVAAPPV